MGTAPDSILRLIDRFDRQLDQVRSPDYNETQLRVDFINPLFRALGWDVDNTNGYAEQYREVVHEDRVKVAGQTKAPDYSFRVGGQRKFFLEAKKPAVDIRNNVDPAYQLRRYAWSAKLNCSLLSDFEELAVYDTRIRPVHLEKASVARREFIRHTDYPSRWDFLAGTFSRDAVLKGDFDRYCESQKGRGAQEFDDAFLGEIEDWRKSLAASLARNNPDLTESGLNFAVQRIIDRIIFLRIAEDRGTETVGQLQALLNGDAVYPRLVTLFRRADERYNSGLFHFAHEKSRDENPDPLTPDLAVDDRTLKTILKALYYPQSPYEFTMVSADILGSIYERFLGKLITLTPAHNARIEEKPEVRKAGGVYYTPAYIVDYIVANTLGKLLADKSPKQAAKLKLLDPACGSGSFLIGAYQFLLDWYHAQYTANNPHTLATGTKPRLRPGPDGGWKLTIAERKRILLDHVHGVDLDSQAVEVTKLNLLLKCLEGETSQSLGFEQRLFRERALPDLGKNIQCGNSLIGTDIIGTDAWEKMNEDERRKINPFDYERAFPDVFKGKDAGFDAVIGNPPYVLAQALEAQPVFTWFGSTFVVAKYKIDTYHLFLECALRATKTAGSLGFIVPNTFIRNRHALELRRFILDESAPRILRLFGYDVFSASVDTAIVITDRMKAAQDAKVNLVRSQTADHFDTSEIPLEAWREHPRMEFLSNAGTPAGLLATKLAEAGPPLGTFATAYFGIQTYDRSAFVANTRRTASFLPVIDGGHISRFALASHDEYVDFRPEAIKSGGNPDVYAKKRIGVRQIGRTPIATILPPKLLTLNTIYNIYFVHPTLYSLEFVLGIIGSKVGMFFWLMNSYDEKKTFPKVKKPDLLRYPLPDLQGREDSSDRLSSLVTSMLSLHQRLSAEKLPQRRQQLQREIDATDRQIDQLVYQLYGLTDAEIQLVEQSTP